MHDIHRAHFPADLETVVDIFREYVTSPTVDLGFQDDAQEFATLPGAYAPPDGCLLLARAGGCAALRRVDAVCAEMKRVYLRPAARGTGLGRRLVTAVLAEAHRLEVLPEFTAAQALHRSLGFAPAPPVSFNPVTDTQFLALTLSARPSPASH